MTSAQGDCECKLIAEGGRTQRWRGREGGEEEKEERKKEKEERRKREREGKREKEVIKVVALTLKQL